MSKLAEIKHRFDYFWVFVPRFDAWKFVRLAGDAQIPVVESGGLWMIVLDKLEDCDAIGVEMPRHPGSVVVPKGEA